MSSFSGRPSSSSFVSHASTITGLNSLVEIRGVCVSGMTVHALPCDEEASFGTFVEAFLGGGFFLEFDNALSDGLSTIVNDHNGTFNATKVLFERVFQQFIGDVG